MPFEIVRNDIVNMQVDAIVNTANPKPVIGYGCDAGIHKKAGPRLLIARKCIGSIRVGDAKITKGYALDCKYVIHAVGPVWQDGMHGEEELLRQCYDRALELAWQHKCESVAFPLLSAGNHGFPKAKALQVAISAFSSFLMEHELQIYLVVFGRDAFRLSEKLFHSVESYIDENYILEKTLDEYGVQNKCDVREAELTMLRRQMERRSFVLREEECEQAAVQFLEPMEAAPRPVSASMSEMELGQLLSDLDAGFSETLLKLIDRSGKKDADIYKRANITRQHFSKIRNNPNYKPTKETAVAFAMALELSLEQTRDLIGRAGYALTNSSKFDVIIMYFISRKNYNLFEINATLFDFDQSLLGG